MATHKHERNHRSGIPLGEIANELTLGAADAKVFGNADQVVSNVQQDSRKVQSGDMFVLRAPLSGHLEAETARTYTANAVAQGAQAILTTPRFRSAVPEGISCIVVDEHSIRQAMGVAASCVHHHPSFKLDVVAVTGTNGKTTSTWVLGAAFDAIFGSASCIVVGTVRAQLGAQARATTHTTPDSDELARLLAWAATEGARFAALETSSHALEQRRLAGTHVRAAAFTNLTQDHLDYHGTMESYFQAKCLLFDELRPGVAIMNIDDPWVDRAARERVHALPMLRTSAHADSPADIRAMRPKFSARGISAEVHTPWGPVLLTSPMIGAHNLSNLLIAVATLGALDCSVSEIEGALLQAAAAPGRLERISRDEDDILVLVDYAHSPDALVRVLEAVRHFAGLNRLLCVFGCGGDRDAVKRPLMGQAVEAGAHIAVLTNDNPRTESPESIAEMILAGMHAQTRLHAEELASAPRGLYVELDRRKAIRDAITHARPGDVVLLAGKGHEDYQIIGTTKHRFLDAEEAALALVTRRETRGQKVAQRTIL